MELYYKLIHDVFNVIALLCAGVLVGVFYRAFIGRTRPVIAIGTAFSAIMLFLYFIPLEMTGITAYLIGAAVILLVSVLTDKRELPQKIFLAMTIYLLDWNVAWGAHASLIAISGRYGGLLAVGRSDGCVYGQDRAICSE